LNFDAAAIALLLFASPGILFVLGLNLGSRVRLLANRQWLLMLALFLVPSITLHYATDSILAFLDQGVREPRILGMLFSEGPALGASPGQIGRPELEAIAHELFISCAMGLPLGFALSKAVIWGWLPTSMLHGPVYPAFSGFRRRYVRSAVLSSVNNGQDHLIYEGFVHDLALTSDGRLAWISLWFPSRTVLEITPAVWPNRRPVSSASTRVSPDGSFLFEDSDSPWMASPEPADLETGADVDVDESHPWTDLLVLEGEDVLNYYILALDVYEDNAIKSWLYESRTVLFRRAIIVLVMIAALLLS
jgi:hypothetical protein